MKKILSFALCVLMLFACLNVSAQSISVELDANKLKFDTPPVNINGRILVPVRTVFEAMGATVSWNAADKTVTSELNGTTVVLTIESPEMTVNGEKKALDVPAKLLNDRTLVPVRAIAEAFGADVSWDAPNTTVNITTQNFVPRTERMKTCNSSDFSISYFEEYDVRFDAADGTNFEIVSESDNHYASLSVRTDAYDGYEPQITNDYVYDVAMDIVKFVSGQLISSEIANINGKDFIKICYTAPDKILPDSGNEFEILTYTGYKNGVAYTMTYSKKGTLPQNVSDDIYYMMNTLIIH